MLSSIQSVDPSPNTKKLFSQLLVRDDDLLSTLKLKKFVANSLPKFHDPSPSNAIPQTL